MFWRALPTSQPPKNLVSPAKLVPAVRRQVHYTPPPLCLQYDAKRKASPDPSVVPIIQEARTAAGLIKVGARGRDQTTQEWGSGGEPLGQGYRQARKAPGLIKVGIIIRGWDETTREWGWSSGVGVIQGACPKMGAKGGCSQIAMQVKARVGDELA